MLLLAFVYELSELYKLYITRGQPVYCDSLHSPCLWCWWVQVGIILADLSWIVSQQRQ